MTGPHMWVFDLDDTLYLERDYVRSGFQAADAFMQAEHGIGGFGADCWRLFEAGRRGDVFDLVLASRGLPDRLVPSLVEVYRQHDPAISLSPEVLTALEDIQARNQTRIAILTGGPSDAQARKLEALDINWFADHVVYAGRRGPDFDKPHPWSWETAGEMSGLPGGNLAYVADNPAKDFDVPLRLGWRTIRVRLPGSLHEDVATPRAVPEVTSLVDAIAHLTKPLA